MSKLYRKVGAEYIDGKCRFCVWAPTSGEIYLELLEPRQESLKMEKQDYGYWYLETELAGPGTKYKFRPDTDEALPDPASCFQPEGVHNSSEVVDFASFRRNEGKWQNPALQDYIIYELHTGTFTTKGTFKGIIQKIPYLKKLGINAIELMPVAEFPGSRNWGYDGVFPFAVHKAYGGPAGLIELVDQCHKNNIAVILDVVYNHLGPEGNYLGRFGPYFSDRYNTPWGEAVNFDDTWSFGFRNYVLNNMLMWFRDYRIDALRLDAVHAIYDFSARHIMEELSREKRSLSEDTGREYYLIAESDLNDVRYISSFEKGGYGMDAQWSDDFHHSVHALVTGESGGYYQDFGTIEHLARTYRNGFCYNGIYSGFRKKVYGNSPAANPASQFIVCSQNHDQIGNRKNGERLTQLTNFELLKTIAVCVLTSPYIPMLFMGEEYAEEHPFLYFVSHTDPELNRLVREGRQKEFRSFYRDDQTDIPDPSDPSTFNNSRLTWDTENKENAIMFEFYRELINIRKKHPILNVPDKDKLEVETRNKLLIVRRFNKSGDEVLIYMNFGEEDVKTEWLYKEKRKMYLLLDTQNEKWLGEGAQLPSKVKEVENLTIKHSSSIILSSIKI